VLIRDQAGWHLSDKLVAPPNITLVPLPPKCPELNPVENVWQFIRDTGSPTASSNTAALPGTSAPTSPGRLCRSDGAIGHSGSDQWDLVLGTRSNCKTAPRRLPSRYRHRESPACLAEGLHSAMSMIFKTIIVFCIGWGALHAARCSALPAGIAGTR
jgi:hypothetical protein